MDLINSLKQYVNMLENSGNFAVYEPLLKEGKATVTIVAGKRGQLSVVSAETFEGDVKKLEQDLKDAQTQLKEAKKTISQYEAEIESLKKETEDTPIQEESTQVKPSIRKTRRPTA